VKCASVTCRFRQSVLLEYECWSSMMVCAELISSFEIIEVLL
jgi:hypothetical protein